MEWMLMPYRRYADFSGRSCRKEYWMFTLFWTLAMLVGVIIFVAGVSVTGGFSEGAASAEGSSGPGILGGLLLLIFGIAFLASIVPSLAVTVRRFHDQDKSGWFFLFNFIPYIGGIILIVFMCIEGTRGPNQYGPDPLNPESDADIFS